MNTVLTTAVGASPATSVVGEALVSIQNAMAEHARIEHAARVPYIAPGESHGVTARPYSALRLNTKLALYVRPILERPLRNDDRPGCAYTASTKTDEIMVTLGAICVMLSLAPIHDARILNTLRERLNRLLAAE